MKRYCILVFTCMISFSLWSQIHTNDFNSGIVKYQEEKYSEALSTFRQILLDPQYRNYHGDAYLWIGKTLIAENRFEDAERNIEFFLSNYPNNSNYPEGLYQRGRILFFSMRYESAIVAFSEFTSQYPDHPFAANAYYWTGEALFHTGYLDQAEKLFLIVISEFPKSYRVEAARYRLSVINLSRREQELLNLLQWTQEEYLHYIEGFRTEELEYQEAIRLYQAGAAPDSSGLAARELEELLRRITQLESENTRLRQLNNEQREFVRVLENDVRTIQNNRSSASQENLAESQIIRSTDADFQQRLDLLALKEKSLILKENLIENLERLIANSGYQQ